MKKITYLRAAVAAAIFLLLISCKKNSNSTSNNNSFQVEYEISPTNNYFTKITYTDQTGNSIVVNDLTTFSAGIKMFTVTTKPFTAKIETEVDNTTTAALNYSVSILINGQLKATTPGLAPAMTASTTTTTQFTVQ